MNQRVRCLIELVQVCELFVQERFLSVRETVSMCVRGRFKDTAPVQACRKAP